MTQDARGCRKKISHSTDATAPLMTLNQLTSRAAGLLVYRAMWPCNPGNLDELLSKVETFVEERRMGRHIRSFSSWLCSSQPQVGFLAASHTRGSLGDKLLKAPIQLTRKVSTADLGLAFRFRPASPSHLNPLRQKPETDARTQPDPFPRKTTRPVLLVAESMGSVLALNLALRSPQLAQVGGFLCVLCFFFFVFLFLGGLGGFGVGRVGGDGVCVCSP